eukprot:COSAG01_NODE_6216_length_3787_cov_1.742950_2_plen_31_part_00
MSVIGHTAEELWEFMNIKKDIFYQLVLREQ